MSRVARARGAALLGALVSAVVPGAGCADVVHLGDQAARVTLEYSDFALFGLTHHDAYPVGSDPRRALAGDGGRIVGHVCGVEVDLAVEYGGDGLSLDGVAVPSPSAADAAAVRRVHLEVSAGRDGARRHVAGVVAGDRIEVHNEHGIHVVALRPGAPAPAAIDFVLTSEGLRGRIGERDYILTNEGDDLVGRFVADGVAQPFVLYGWEAVWSLPAADQAALLPFLLSCRDASARLPALDLTRMR